MADPVEFYPLKAATSLVDLLEIATPPFRKKADAFLQLNYLADYVRRADLNQFCEERSIAIEDPYVDRDFMADYSVLFGTTLKPPKSYCRRLHFFALPPKAACEQVLALGERLIGGGEKAWSEYTSECAEFSQKSYLGFAVIRPLAACSVGRTVLHLLPFDKPTDKSVREMRCTRDYCIHYLGARLTIRGLAFQQQDLGVSRCSTIAIWSALHKASESEHLASATPAEITNLASKYRLPFGRPMPSEGLAVDQMCIAMQSLGVSPFLSKVMSFAQGRSLIFSATLSEMPCVLVMQKADEEDLWHAVTVAGMKLHAAHKDSFVKEADPSAGNDESGDLKAVYVHDDRVGPYLRAEIYRSTEGQLRVRMNVQGHVENGKTQEWIVQQVLIPLHSKIRMSFNDLRKMTLDWLIPEIQKVVAAENNIKDSTKLQTIQFRNWIERGHRFVRRVLTEKLLSEKAALFIRTNFMMPRYVAVIRLISQRFGQIDILVDTTSPRPNHMWLAVLCQSSDDEKGKLRHLICEYMAEQCRCSYIT
jgi:hypothetical protein